MSLDLSIVRAVASQNEWREVQFNGHSRVVGFERGKERINVYYTTGTVGTCTDHPRLGKTQLFRRNVDYNELLDLMKNIRSHTGKGYYRKVNFDKPDFGPKSSNLNWWCTTDNDMADLVEGNGRYDANDYPIMVLGSSWLGIDKEGRPCWGAGLPKQLDNKLRGRQNWLPTVDVVCLGPNGNDYFVQFSDGSQEWLGIPSELANYIREDDCKVESIALGPDDSYFCKWENGATCWSGLPRALYNKLNGRQKSLPAVSHVNLGPNGEYFVLFEDGNWQAGGNLAQGCDRAIDKIQEEERGTIYDVQFGHDFSWLIRYSE